MRLVRFKIKNRTEINKFLTKTNYFFKKAKLLFWVEISRTDSKSTDYLSETSGDNAIFPIFELKRYI